jgi:hypothetical protein
MKQNIICNFSDFKLYLLLFLLPFKASAQFTDPMKHLNPFTSIGNNAITCFTDYNLLFHAGGAVATYSIIKSDLDYDLHNYFFKNKNKFNAYSLPAVYIGYLSPLLLGGGMYISGLAFDNTKTATAGCAVLQASLLAFTEMTVLKAITGRQNPDAKTYTKETDKSSSFRFGFLRNGIHYGWPSGHMMVSTAMVSCLSSFYSDNKLLIEISWVAWVYMLTGVTVHDGNTMHWFSDIVAGSMMGYAIGNTVGKSFRLYYHNSKLPGVPVFQINPVVGYQFAGLKFETSW